MRPHQCRAKQDNHTTNESLNDIKRNPEFFPKSDFEGFGYYLISVKLKEVTEGQSKCFIDYFTKIFL